MLKELTSNECEAILISDFSGSLSFSYNKSAFVYPMNYFFAKEHNYILCFANQIKEIAAIAKRSTISFEVSKNTQNGIFEHVLVHGTIETVLDGDDEYALDRLQKVTNQIIQNQDSTTRAKLLKRNVNKICDEHVPKIFKIMICCVSGKRYHR